MMNKADNDLLTRIEAGTPMGAMLREYWVPACRAARLEAGGAPEKVRLFGENFGLINYVIEKLGGDAIAWQSNASPASAWPRSTRRWAAWAS